MQPPTGKRYGTDVRDDEWAFATPYRRLPDVVAGLHFLAFVTLMLHPLDTVARRP